MVKSPVRRKSTKCPVCGYENTWTPTGDYPYYDRPHQCRMCKRQLWRPIEEDAQRQHTMNLPKKEVGES